MEANDIDDILQDLGVSVPSTPPSQSAEPTNEDSVFSDEDIDSILEENGIENNIEGEEEMEEEIDDTDSLERQSEEEDSLATVAQRIHEAVDEYLAEHSTPVENPVEESGNEALIPLNSPTLLLDEATTRFSGAEWFNEIQKARIIIGGCGGIGSNLIFQLARMVPANLTIYDDDIVERTNMAGQLYGNSDIGDAKVDAIAKMVGEYTTIRQINAVKERFTINTEPGDIMLCGFDNMVARKTFFNSWKEHLEGKSDEEKAKCLFMDGRLSICTLQILCIKGNDAYNIKRYSREFLFHDSQADATVCSMKQTTYLACMIGSLMTNLFTNFIAGTLDPIIPYDLPFFTEYDAQNMIFKTEN